MILNRQLGNELHLLCPTLIDLLMKFLTKSIPVYYLVLTVLLAGSLLLYRELHPVKVIEKIESKNNSELRMIRNTKFKYIRPVVLADRTSEDDGFQSIKSSLNNYINSEKNAGELKSASIYVREFEQGKWFSINPDEQFSPGSIMKIATLLTFLKDSERNPEILNQRLQFKAHYSEMPVQTIVSGQLVSGRYYSVKELLEAMIIDSDNDATVLLNQTINMNTYFDLLKLINYSIPEKGAADYPLTTVECSRMLRIIFNSSYLEPKNSEYAMVLLTQSKFQDGIKKLIPENVTVAHKFGERFNPIEQQLHETAIIYADNKPYLLTVMTKGTDQQKLKTVLNSISKSVYDFMSNR